MSNSDRHFEFDLEHAYDVSVPLDQTLAYIAINMRDRLNSIHACCEMLVQPECQEYPDHCAFVLKMIPRVVADFISMQTKVEKLTEVRGQVDTRMKKDKLSNNEKEDHIPVETPPEVVLVDIACYFHFGTSLLHEYAGKLLQEGRSISDAEAMKELAVSMKRVLQMSRDYYNERIAKR